MIKSYMLTTSIDIYANVTSPATPSRYCPGCGGCYRPCVCCKIFEDVQLRSYRYSTFDSLILFWCVSAFAGFAMIFRTYLFLRFHRFFLHLQYLLSAHALFKKSLRETFFDHLRNWFLILCVFAILISINFSTWFHLRWQWCFCWCWREDWIVWSINSAANASTICEWQYCVGNGYHQWKAL